MWIFDSLKKSKKLRQISRKLDTSHITNIADLLNYDKNEQDEVLDQLCDLCLNDPNIVQIMNQYGIGRGKLKELYKRMCAVGYGIWAKGHYIAASSIVYRPTLDYLLRNENAENFQNIAYRIYIYFESGEMSPFINN